MHFSQRVVVFSTKRRHPLLVAEVRDRVHYWLNRLVDERGFRVLEWNSWLDHIHLVIFVPSGHDLSEIINVLKGVSARRVFQEFPDLKSQIGENHLWGRRFHATEVPADALEKVCQYVRQQEVIHTTRAAEAPVAAWERWRDLG